MNEKITAILNLAIESLNEATEISKIEEIRVKYLGKKGELTSVLKQLGSLSPEERPVVGQLVNKAKAELEEIAKEKLMKARENEINLLKSRLAKLISDHQALAKEYRQELAQIISFNDFLSVPREFSKAV